MNKKFSRRHFLEGSALLGASVPMGIIPIAASLTGCSNEAKSKEFTPEELGMFSFVDSAPDGKPLKAALIGNGNRGTGAAGQFLSAGKDLSIIALADVLPDRQERCRKILKEQHNNEVPDSNCFIGFDAYKKILNMPEVDVVLIATPCYFHPYQCKEAIEAGKHVFMEKSGGVDPVGIRALIAAGKEAEARGLTLVTGNQRRHRRDYWEALVQVRNGIIGDPISASCHWDGGASWNRKRLPEWSDMEYTIRNWYNIKWLIGDIMLGWLVHNIDIVNWFMGMTPETAIGYGGSARRVTGDSFSFFSIDYTYPNGKRMLGTTRQIDATNGRLGEYISGTKGIAKLNDDNNIEIVNFDGESLWKYDYANKPVKDPYHQEHIHLVESIRLNKKINQAQDLANATLTGIMGREAAYTGNEINRDEMLFSNLRYGPLETDISLFKMGPLPFYHEGESPVPGKDPAALS